MFPYITIVLPSYAVMAFIGGAVAVGFLFFRIDKYHISFTDFLLLCLSGAVGILIGSKALFAITQIPWLIENFSIKNLILIIPQSGFVYYGGLLGLLLAIRLYQNKAMKGNPDIYQFFAPAVPLFHFWGRIGCFMAGCCYGKDLPSPLDLYFFTADKIPVQLIEAVSELILFIVLLIIEKKKHSVHCMKIYLAVYSCLRFLYEFLRGDELRGIFFGLSTSQWISVIIIICISVSYVKKHLCGNKICDNLC